MVAESQCRFADLSTFRLSRFGNLGLATGYYLASLHGIANVAVIEEGPIGPGNGGRNTTIVRSNSMLPSNTRFYEKSLQLWEGLEQATST